MTDGDDYDDDGGGEKGDLGMKTDPNDPFDVEFSKLTTMLTMRMTPGMWKWFWLVVLGSVIVIIVSAIPQFAADYFGVPVQ